MHAGRGTRTPTALRLPDFESPRAVRTLQVSEANCKNDGRFRRSLIAQCRSPFHENWAGSWTGAGDTPVLNPHGASGSAAELDTKRGERMSDRGDPASPHGQAVDQPGR